ncbi:hypothetical protein FK531_10770 [Rhodococcus spelaei]|uniref:DUF6545 domain-containing protein n=1 Tax=Rhodococcus spelaei TaxID=2546320 RepID=A0A541BAB3_9NOCA|nr:MAB_1171c family putative transporter [Rhodococcus spelaei]TQF69223.1 hypothetical protein FK531_10770 [Rhodococcus spelaei]
MPAVVMWPLLIGIWVITVIRLIVMRTGPAQRRINMILVFWAAVATLRAPEVQSALESHLTDIAVIRPLTHLFAMLAGAAILGLAAAITMGPAEPSWRQPLVYAVTLPMGLSLLFLSGESRASGLTIEEAGGWQCAAYFVVYAIPMVIAVTVVLGLCVEVLRSAPARREGVAMVILCMMCVLSLLDNISRPVAAFFSAAHVDNALTRWRAESNDVLFLPEVALVAVVSAIPVVTMLLRRRELRQLAPMWSTLTETVPQVVLPASGFEERLHRTVVEIWDATMMLEPYESAAEDTSLERELDRRGIVGDKRIAVRRSVQLLRACERKRTGRHPLDAAHGRSVDLGNEDPASEKRVLLGLARSWKLAATIAFQDQTDTEFDARERSEVRATPLVTHDPRN